MQINDSISFEEPHPGVFLTIVHKRWKLREVEDFLLGVYTTALINHKGRFIIVWDVSTVTDPLPAGLLSMLVRTAPSVPDRKERELARFGVGVSRSLEAIGSLLVRLTNSSSHQIYFATCEEAIEVAVSFLESAEKLYMDDQTKSPHEGDNSSS